MSTRMQSRSRKSGATVLHWLMFALSPSDDRMDQLFNDRRMR